MAKTMAERSGKEVRISHSRIGIAADEVLENEDEAEAGSNATTGSVNTTPVIHTTRAKRPRNWIHPNASRARQ